MKHYIGIDLGTTNSAICSFDGLTTRLWKSPEQNDVTPSAIYIDRRGNKIIGKRAYDNASRYPKNTAMLFKRFMGTSTPIDFPDLNISKTPEECSAEILKVLFGYLPEEIRNDPDTGTVITVPAAFNQMQKTATMQAAEMAGIGKVALMQEPVAAIMSVMRVYKSNGMFLIYDLGGGTLDVAIAQNTDGRVNLLAHGGIAMCGGRDFDRKLVDNVVIPWLNETFDLPEDFPVNPKFQRLVRMAAWAAEQAKIELSSKEETKITLLETDIMANDLGGKEIYFDIPLDRVICDKLFAGQVDDTIKAARDTIAKAGLAPHDIERIVFIGGPNQYVNLRNKVTSELGIAGGLDVNPMTAVAEGASLFAESIDWSTQNRSKKNSRGELVTGGKLNLSFNYYARTPDVKAKIILQLEEEVTSGSEFQIDSIDTGWTSGRFSLAHGAIVDVFLPEMGENHFKTFVFDPFGGPISLEQDKITITRTAASVDSIPASHTISVEALIKPGSTQTKLERVVKAGESLPLKKDKILFKAAESLKAGSDGALVFRLWEGDIKYPINANRRIGELLINGSDFDNGVIPAGADLEFAIEMLDSGVIMVSASVPCIGFTSSTKNFYSPQGGQYNFSDESERIIEEADLLQRSADEMSLRVNDSKLEQARQKLKTAQSLDPNVADAEKAQEAHENNLEAKKIISQVREAHVPESRQMDLDNVTFYFQKNVQQYARPNEIEAFEKLTKTAQQSIDKNDDSFEGYLDELRGKNFEILWRQDWFVIDWFKDMASSPYNFIDARRFKELVDIGERFLNSGEIENLRSVVVSLWNIQFERSNQYYDASSVNIIRG
ncbi:MAG: Hsp70 family protein [Synergistaceae bacterium]|nr:Hsp70 family protein [Synergistaceae bacterium]